MEESKGIGIIIRTLSVGGAEKQSVLLANALASHHRVYLFIQYPIVDSRIIDLVDRDNVRLITLKGNFLSKASHLIAQCKEHHIKVVFAYLSSDNVLASIAGLFVPHLSVFGGIRSSKLPKHKFLMLKLLHRYFQTATIFNNNLGRDAFVKRGFQPSKSLVVANCPDHINPYHNRTNNGMVNIITAGRFVSAKDYPMALKAIQHLKQKLGSTVFKYTIIGYGALEDEIRQLILKLELGDVVEVVINPPDIDQYYKNAELYLCSSSFEGLSNSIMEALNHSMAIVATHVGDNHLLVQHEKNGYLVPVENAIETSKALEKLITDEHLRKNAGKASHDLLKRDFSPEHFTQQYLNIIDKTCKC
jgi:glycosyltransferase involved in cell wall biosynthesis